MKNPQSYYIRLMIIIGLTFSAGVPASANGDTSKSNATRMMLKTPLSAQPFPVDQVEATEELFGAYNFRVEISGVNGAIMPEQILGQNVTLSIELADMEQRYFNGLVSRFSAGDEDADGRRDYQLQIVPGVWFLSLGADSRIFQNRTLTEIVAQVVRDGGVSDFRFDLTSEDHLYECVIQYNESDLDFVRRLLEERGIQSYFIHEDGRHTLVMTDTNVASRAVTLPYIGGKNVAKKGVPGVTRFKRIYAVLPGKYTHSDDNFQMPSDDLTASAEILEGHALDAYEKYEYPGLYREFSDGEMLARTRIEEIHAGYDTVRGQATGMILSPRERVNLTGLGEGFDGEYYITSVQHTVTPNPGYENGKGSSNYTNTFTAIPAGTPFRPQRVTPRPIVAGPQTAIVTGPAGTEIYTDEFGRVKVQFHWDREGQMDENSSCWMRVVQPNTGGTLSIPQIGDEVLVEFEHGDVDRPVIVGRLYNDDDRPPPGGE